MNKYDRKELKRAIALLDKEHEIIESVKDIEQGKFDNLPEGLQQSEKGQKFEETVSTLEDALNSIEEATASINYTM